MTRDRRAAAGVLAAVFLALHLPFFPPTLEDLDSINFALGVRHFDVAQHQPHPPGYPVFIAAAKTVNRLVHSEVVALSAVSMVSGAVALLALVVVFRRLDRTAENQRRAVFATALTAAAPLYWFTASRPLSDMGGLAAALAVQALALSASTTGALAAAGFCAGLATGIRSQIAWLTAPCLLLVIASSSSRARAGALMRVIVYGVAGALVWFVPLVWLTGGPSAYWQVLFKQGAEDLSGVTMLWTTPTVREFVRALYFAFVSPWGPVALGSVVLACAAIGFLRLLGRAPSTLARLLVVFGPYLIFDILFQETVTTRYALPIVIPIAFFAIAGLDVAPRGLSTAAACVLCLVGAWTGERALQGYARVPAPAFQMLAQMSAANASAAGSPVLAMHRREDFDLRRPIAWAGGGLPQFEERLPATAKHEWLQVVNYWNRGGRQPVWFIADPLRSDLALFQHAPPRGAYRWGFDELSMIGGVRPSETDWYIVDPPAWYLGEGWSVTPETAGIAREDRRDLAHRDITGWVKREPGEMNLMIGGRNLSTANTPAAVRLAIDGRPVETIQAAPGFFLRMVSLPGGALEGTGDYAALTVAVQAVDSSGNPVADAARPDVAIEQFDIQPASHVVFGYGDGWHEREYNPATGKLWRWTGNTATVRIRSESRQLMMSLVGETETFRRPSHVVIRAGDMQLASQDVGDRFSLAVPIPASAVVNGEAEVTITTDQTYVPAERGWRRLPDHRRLGLKIYDCAVVP